MAPIATPMDISTIERVLIWPKLPMWKASGTIKAAQATNTAAKPTSEWKAATSCGMAVIGIRRAITAPMPAPMPSPEKMSPQVNPEEASNCNMVVTTAMAMPIMPYMLPLRELSGDERPRKAMIKRTPATT